tara:strand:+ start:1154 stop:1849 length:696 start_codon:yes stop_codon:yes gene_type:complete
LETTLKILIRKKFFLLSFLLFFTQLCYTQSVIGKDFYREDQFYFGSSYFIQTEPIENFKQNGFSGNFQFGFIRDFPLNNNSTKAIGIGLGYERNFFTSNIQPIKTNGNINYRIVISRFLESKNKISFSSFVLPIEYRWRSSSIDQYKFWRIYSGLKIKKNFPLYSNPSYGSEITIDEIEDWTTSIYLNTGYNTWNISLEYDLNPILKNQKTSNGENLNISFFRLGLVFYIL